MMVAVAEGSSVAVDKGGCVKVGRYVEVTFGVDEDADFVCMDDALEVIRMMD